MAKSKKAHSGEGTHSKDGEYFVWTRQVGRRRYVVKRKDYTEYRKEIARRQKEIETAGVMLPAKEASIEQFVPTWVEAFISPPKRSHKTHKNYLSLYNNHVRPKLGKIKLSKLTRVRVQTWVNELQAAGVPDGQVRQAHMVLSKACDAALIEGRITRNPCLGCEVPTAEEKPVHVLSLAESEGLLREAFRIPPFAAEPSRYRHLFRFMLSTGMRSGEVFGLLRTAVDLKRGILHVRTQLDWKGDGEWELIPPKKGAFRSIVLESEAIKAIKQHIAMVRRERRIVEDYEDNGLVFASLRGTPAIHRNVQRQLDALLDRATWVDEDGKKRNGIDHVGLHELRRTCLTNLANRGLPMHQLKAYAGHTSIQTTARYYIHVSLEAQREAIAALIPANNARSVHRSI